MTPATRTRIGILILALGAAAALVLLPLRNDEPTPAARAALATVWPDAQRAEFSANLADGPIFHPGLFLDARTAIGTAPAPSGDRLRLLVRNADGTVRELRRRPLAGNPVFDAFATDGTTVAWTESVDGRRTEIWAATVPGPARRLTADTGNVLSYGSQYDLVVADGAVHWAAADGDVQTEIRSVPVAGGPVSVRAEPGVWSLTTWPWLVDGAGDRTGTTRLRNPVTLRDVEVESSGAELTSCSPAWCRVLVITGEGVARIDEMRPDGSDRRRIAGSEATAAVTDVAVLDRFEVLAEPRPDSDLTGTEGLVLHDLAERRTVELSAAVDGAFSRNGVLWWSTGDQDTMVWHTLDLRTV
jgi:hypothetical protein